MLVKFGLPMYNPGVKYKHPVAYDVSDAITFYATKFMAIKNTVAEMQLLGVTHLRLPNLVFNGSLNIIEEALTSPQLQIYKNTLLFSLSTFSVHCNYKMNSLTLDNLEYLITYLKKLKLVKDFLGLTSLHIITHVNYGDINETLFVLKNIRVAVPEDIFSSITLENTEYGLNIKQCIQLANEVGILVCPDSLHNKINGGYTPEEITNDLYTMWNLTALQCKMHYSNGNMLGAHNEILDFRELCNYLLAYKRITDVLIVMLEIQSSLQALQNLRYLYQGLQWQDDLTFIL